MKINIIKRKSIRIKDYNYAKEGYYFITICTKDRKPILSKVNTTSAKFENESKNNVKLSKIGEIARDYIENYKIKFNNIIIDEYIIMPNHVHMIIRLIGSPWGATPTIGKIVNNYKALITKQLGYSIWQRNYYEHIIRNEREYMKIKEYIKNNPINWEKDKYF